MPVMGMMPMVMPAFWNTLKATKVKSPVHTRRPKTSRDWPAARRTRQAMTPRSDKQPDGADEAQLLTHGGEDEVGRLLGHVAEVGLRPVQEPGPEEPARADGVLGLGRVVDGRSAPAGWCWCEFGFKKVVRRAI